MNLSHKPTRDELQQLMELPHQQVVEILRKNDLWDITLDPRYHKYEVEVIATWFDDEEDWDGEGSEIDGWADVWAMDIVEAQAKARALEAHDIIWDRSAARDSEVEDIEVTSVTRILLPGEDPEDTPNAVDNQLPLL